MFDTTFLMRTEWANRLERGPLGKWGPGLQPPLAPPLIRAWFKSIAANIFETVDYTEKYFKQKLYGFGGGFKKSLDPPYTDPHRVLERVSYQVYRIDVNRSSREVSTENLNPSQKAPALLRRGILWSSTHPATSALRLKRTRKSVT